MTLDGIYTEVHGDSKYFDETKYFLETPARTYELTVASPPKVHSRAEVKVTGTLSGDRLDIRDPQSATGAPRLTQLAPAPAIAAIGTKLVLVINVQWAGGTLTASTAQEQNFLFGTDSRSLASYYREVSYGQMSWTGAITPAYAISDPGTCDLSNLASSAEAAATAGGYVPSSYDSIIVNAPSLHCAAVGYGQIGGKHVWIENGLWNLDDGYARLVPTHEIGHSLGLYHSHGLECGAETVTTACLTDPGSHNEEYGNAYDVMGNNWPGDVHDSVTWFSAKQEMLLGWLTATQVKVVATSGTYTLTPLEQQGAATPQVLVLATPGHTYYIEYRRPIGQDAFLASFPAATNGVHVNVRDDMAGDTGPFALDFAPDSNLSGGYYDWFDAPLPTGSSFADPERAFTITPTAVDAAGATVNVTLAASVPTAPTIGTAAAGHSQATVAWVAPSSDGGAPITGYVVTPYVNGVAEPSRRFDTTATTQSITALTNGTTYTFKVAALNSVGTGPQSMASNAVKPK